MFTYFSFGVKIAENDLLKKRYHIIFCWAREHKGIVGNGVIDKAYKQTLNPLNYDILYSDIKHIIRNCVRYKRSEH